MRPLLGVPPRAISQWPLASYRVPPWRVRVGRGWRRYRTWSRPVTHASWAFSPSVAQPLPRSLPRTRAPRAIAAANRWTGRRRTVCRNERAATIRRALQGRGGARHRRGARVAGLGCDRRWVGNVGHARGSDNPMSFLRPERPSSGSGDLRVAEHAGGYGPVPLLSAPVFRWPPWR